ncbi:MAG TPA: addiction module toxin, HicA family [Petrimonas sp.]|uniref:type II toxin-antitoxin system HicA family toxin n=1 Tax=Petrimonas sp. TaxID=2023866 RepID=UPI000968FB64|nr:MAG: addiction module toxin, HicA family [Bacteroidia bacterium 43-41]HHV86122.1 addiction module toxin, HicA family [Petrimonas sp.]
MKIWKVKEMISYIKADGWMFIRQKGSHRQYRHPTKSGTVTIPGKFSDDLPPNTAKSILKQTGLI